MAALIPHSQICDAGTDEALPWYGWLPVWLVLLKVLCSKVHSSCVNLRFTVLCSVTALGNCRTSVALDWQDCFISTGVFFLHHHWTAFFPPQAYIWRGWEGFWWDFGQRERNEPWWPNPWCLTDPQRASENQQYGRRGEQMNKVGVVAFGCYMDWQCVTTQ